jgi:formate C-acetyltransferase
LRLQLQHRGPKYGNDDDYADLLARRVLDDFVDLVEFEVAQHPCPPEVAIQFPPAAGTFEMYRIIGNKLGASADGRTPGQPIASNVSPMPGADHEGPLAALRSYAKLNLTRLPSGTAMDLSLQQDAVAGEAGRGRLVGLLRSFVQLGGQILTISVNSVEELRAAQREPHKWGHLRVRMGGWSAYFVCLDREHQEHHIARYQRWRG